MNSFKMHPFSEEIYKLRYAFGDESIERTFARVAKALAQAEKEEDRARWESKFSDLLQDFKFVPGGRILANAGTGIEKTTWINCYVSGPTGYDIDSIDSIQAELARQTKILSSEGGYGFCANFMRPRGTYVVGAGIKTPGAVAWLDLWDTSSSILSQAGGVETGKHVSRRGAQMVTMSCWHPDVEEFITAKQTPGRLTKFNMSVLITDAFLEAVEKHLPWSLVYPDIQKDEQLYKEKWDGNIEKWPGDVKVYKRYEDANELWNLIMKSTYHRNEPGIIFSDRVNLMNNLYYCEYLNATNPCSEQNLPIGGVCLLGSFNLTQFIKDNDFDREKLAQYIPTAVRFLDNVNDLTFVPLPEQKENLLNKRRMGLGYMGYGSALMMLGLRYGSEEALRRTHEFLDYAKNKIYQASVELAKEKGAFHLFDQDKYLQSRFVQSLWPETQELISRYGIRNSHLLSIQPTGTSAILANNVSGGLEPIFLSEYIRTTVFPVPPVGLSIPSSIDWQKRNELNPWKWKNEGDEWLLYTEWDGYTWKIDQHRGLLRETLIEDYAVHWLKERGRWDVAADWAATTSQLKIEDHIRTLELFAQHVDASISKTCNLPADYPYSEFQSLYLKAGREGHIKGITTYRDGTMASVLAPVKKEVMKTERPEALPCDIQTVKAEGETWLVLIGLQQGKPYEVFALKPRLIQVGEAVKTGMLRKRKEQDTNVYDLETDYFTIQNLASHFERDEEEALTRMISAALKHNTQVSYVYSQLMKAKGSIVSFSRAIARSLARYVEGAHQCPECKEHTLEFKEGCMICRHCGHSKCG